MRIGIDLGGTKIAAVILDDAGRQIAARRVPTSQSYPTLLGTFVGLVEALEAETGHHCSVGVGTPGAVSPATGLMKNCDNTPLTGKPFDRDLSQALGRPVRIANDANCFALSEAVDGAGKGGQTVFGVIVGTGVGAGVVIDQRVLTGPNAIAGEWGHNPLPWPKPDEIPGPRCYCGRDSCIEQWLAGPAVAKDHEAVTGKPYTAPNISRRALDGDVECKATMERYADRMARAFSSVINILDPDYIVLGGGVSKIAEIYDTVPPRMKPWVFSDTIRTKIVRNEHGDDSGVRGAAWLWAPGEYVRADTG